MKIVKSLVNISLVGIAFASLIPHLIPAYWLTDIFSHFKLQYLILLVLLFVTAALVVKKAKFQLIFILILLGWNSWFIIPLYLAGTGKEDPLEENFSILMMNLLASNTNYSEAIDLIREKDPDVVVLLELSPQWHEQMEVMSIKFPYQEMVPQQNNFGIGIMSKTPLAAEVKDFGQGFPPSILSRLQINGRKISILATHPVPPVSQEMFNLRNEQFKAIANLSRGEEGNFILAGDLNSSSYSEHFDDLLENGRLTDSRIGFGIASTWPTDLFFLRTTLDHFLLKGELQVLERTTERSIGSDHLPVFLRLSINN